MRTRSAVAKGLVVILLLTAVAMVTGPNLAPSLAARSAPVGRPAGIFLPHAPIMITSEAGFNATNGVTGGTGTAADPYVISGWEIDATTMDGIWISETSSHYVIRHVYVHASVDWYWGVFAGAPNGTVEDSIFVGNGGAVHATSDVVILRNQVVMNGTGFFVGGSNVDIRYNNVSAQDPSAAPESGVDAYWAQNVTVTGNNFLNANVYFRCTYRGLVADNVNVNGSRIVMASAVGVSIFHNTLINSTAGDDLYWDDHGMGCGWAPGNNTWDDGFPSGGNYWSAYPGTDHCSGALQNVCTGPDGIGDTPMPIPTFNPSAPGNFVDRYPLMQPYRGPLPILFYTLYGSAAAGWGLTPANLSNPGPTLTAYVDVPVNLTLYGVDGATHGWFLDYNGNSMPDVGEPAAPDFNLGPEWFVFTPTVSGMFTYRCPIHPLSMQGTMQVFPGPPNRPTASFTVTPTVGNRTTTFSVDASGSANGTGGSAGLAYRWDWNGDGTWDTAWSSLATANHTYVADGKYRIVLQILTSENVTADAAQWVLVDSVPPETAVHLSGTLGSASWYRSSVTVNLTATDMGGGVGAIRYSIDTGAQMIYSDPFVISTAGSHLLYVSSIDVAMNIEPPQTVTVRVDATPPVLLLTSPSGVVPALFRVNWTATDAGSGIDHYEASLDNGTYASLGLDTSLALNLTEGDHSVKIRAVDVAGNSVEAGTVLRVAGTSSPRAPNPEPLSPGMIAIIGLAVGAGAVTVAYTVVRIRAARRRPRGP